MAVAPGRYAFAAIFCTEMVLKMCALGLFIKDGGYFKDPWNRLDAIVVLASLLSFALPVRSRLRPPACTPPAPARLHAACVHV